MTDEFYKIGQVIEVRGQRIRIRVFENKNSNILIYKGQVVKNVSVGSFVKIPKGYSNIIGKIEGEYIQEINDPKVQNRFTKESETIDRIIEVSIVGVLDNNSFKRGLIDIPLVFSDVYILMDDEVQKIFQFGRDPENSICIGSINDYKEEKLHLDTSSLFASHIGIFGNTGSGKSNTLAKIYTEVIDKYKNYKGFKHSQFILIDFNGEYSNAFCDDKTVYHLSTKANSGDKIPMPPVFLEDLEIWAIVCEATEKTQKPFLDKVIGTYKRIHEANDQMSYIKSLLEHLFSYFYENPLFLVKELNILKEILSILSENTTSANMYLDTFTFNTSNQARYIVPNGNRIYFNNEADYKSEFCDKIIESLHLSSQKKITEYGLFEFALKYKYLNDLCLNYINEEYVSPLISRFNRRVQTMKKIFSIEDNNISNWFSIYSLIDVNVEFKKIIPLIICKYSYEVHKSTTKTASLHIIIDEAHNILSTSSERESQAWKDYRLETFEEIIKEGRKFGVFLTISSQRPSDISETIISQLHNYFIHRLVNNEDIKSIGKAVAFIDKTSYEMISVLPQGACIFTGVASNFPVLVQVDMLNKDRQPQSSTIDLIKLWK